MTDTPMNLRLAMAAWSVTHDEDEPWDDAPAIEKHPYMLEVDAIFREMLEPSETALDLIFGPAVGPESMREFFKTDLQGYLQHIRNESQD